ncbi:hypothetical protein [Rhodothermus bifroesti]|uniref:Uncharacterized protein n=1 Tax=Rhodothermus marinus TaxID=29549 RepID=A0A7V2F614_RHOMR|nr:hypothetical protein [Rhodothermus bifroesti]GBD00665.1 hypothetical protein HRbin18_00377 [bacterium HR18]
MPERYETFDDLGTLHHIRYQVAWTVALTLIGLVSGLVLLGLTRQHTPADLLIAGLLCISWGILAAWAALRLHRLQQLFWRITFSDTAITGYDYSRHAHTIGWHAIERLELTDQDLRLHTENGRQLIIPNYHAAFPVLGRILIDWAERTGCPLYLNGQPFEAINIRSFLALPPDITLPADSASTS